jgi:hypothetical protein
MNKRFAGLMLIFSFLMLIPLQSFAATARETVETGVNKVLKTFGDPTFQAKPKDVKIAEIGNIISEFFNFPPQADPSWVESMDTGS